MIPMQRSSAGPAFLLVLTLSVAACGGGGAASPADGASGDDGGAAATGDATEPTDAPAATDAAAATDAPAASDPGTGGGNPGSADICALGTADELTAIFGEAVETHYDPVAPKTCFVRASDGRIFAHWTMDYDTAAMMYDALGGGETQVAGLGDKAKHLENFGLMILKGDVGATIVVAAESGLGGDDAKAAAEQVGAMIVGRM
jgi:hypothetical protein